MAVLGVGGGSYERGNSVSGQEWSRYARKHLRVARVLDMDRFPEALSFGVCGLVFRTSQKAAEVPHLQNNAPP